MKQISVEPELGSDTGDLSIVLFGATLQNINFYYRHYYFHTIDWHRHVFDWRRHILRFNNTPEVNIKLEAAPVSFHCKVVK